MEMLWIVLCVCVYGIFSGNGGESSFAELVFHFDFVLSEICGGAVEDDAAVVDEYDTIADGADFLEDVGGEEDSFGFGEFEDEVTDALDLIGIETAGGFIEDEDVGVVEHGVCHADALAKAAGEFGDGFAPDFCEGAFIGDPGHAFGEAVAGKSADFAHVLQE